MVDGTVLLVDAGEGPMAQTRFVLPKGFALYLNLIVVLNKMDRPVVRPDVVRSELLDSSACLDATKQIFS